MKTNSHLNFDGCCEAAFKFYERCLSGKIAFSMTWEASPMADKVPSDWKKKIVHASFDFNGQRITGGDAPPNCYSKPAGFAVALHIEKPEEADRIFNALGERGNIQMPMEETFWARRFGMLTDQFGTPWMINCPKPEFTES